MIVVSKIDSGLVFMLTKNKSYLVDDYAVNDYGIIDDFGYYVWLPKNYFYTLNELRTLKINLLIE